MAELDDAPAHNRSRAASFKRALSISAGLNRMSADQYPQPPAVPPPPSSPVMRSKKSFSLPKRASAPAQQPTHSRGPSQYYNDPDARRKLKQYLASPQNFEEALEFGFPATLAGAGAQRPAPPKLHLPAKTDAPAFPASGAPWNYNHSSSSFIRDWQASLDQDQEDNYDDNSSDCDTSRDSPKTPVGPSQSYHAISSDTPQFLFPPYRHAWDDTALTGEREMTMRLTLTKPTLRDAAPASLSDDPYLRRDLLDLDPLPSLGDHEALKSLQGPGATDTGKVRGLWRRLRAKKA